MKVMYDDAEAPAGSIHLKMDLEDFRKAVVAEMVSPMKVWTKKQLDDAILEAVTAAIEKVKLVTIGNM